MEKNAIAGRSEIWLTADDKASLWNAVLDTHELIRCDRSAINSKTKEVV